MVIDLTILGLVLFFAILGAIAGAAKQVANMAGMALGYFASRRLGPVLGPKLAVGLGVPLLAGAILATVLVFVVVWLSVRYALGALLRRFLSGKSSDERGADRVLGFVLGGAKVSAVIWVALSALTFFEQHVVVAGKRVGVSPRDAMSVQLARRYNLFELTQFAPLGDLVRVAQASADPEKAAKLKDDPAYKALRKDPRFQIALKDETLREALERGDTRAVLRSDVVLQLIQDPEAAARLAAAAHAAQREGVTR